MSPLSPYGDRRIQNSLPLLLTGPQRPGLPTASHCGGWEHLGRSCRICFYPKLWQPFMNTHFPICCSPLVGFWSPKTVILDKSFHFVLVLGRGFASPFT